MAVSLSRICRHVISICHFDGAAYKRGLVFGMMKKLQSKQGDDRAEQNKIASLQDAYLNTDIAESLRGFPALAPRHKHFQLRFGFALACHLPAYYEDTIYGHPQPPGAYFAVLFNCIT